MSLPDKSAVLSYLKELQNSICDCLQNVDGEAVFVKDQWLRDEGGGGESRVLTEGGE